MVFKFCVLFVSLLEFWRCGKKGIWYEWHEWHAGAWARLNFFTRAADSFVTWLSEEAFFQVLYETLTWAAGRSLWSAVTLSTLWVSSLQGLAGAACWYWLLGLFLEFFRGRRCFKFVLLQTLCGQSCKVLRGVTLLQPLLLLFKKVD